ncbi:hypothetical protein N1030_12405 [Desulfovibrio mangrovi]|uniref:hypothetical protein n=1 Tax=Desulfovibrio mangrovi TaxID=2976983 RepID=UPI00224799CE|nr:hypothetical protein [Desulfovibrio mangrovi]UZP66408.1 hypothetical protein N1030_12405 [Desulfovibrio mangrovi]
MKNVYKRFCRTMTFVLVFLYMRIALLMDGPSKEWHGKDKILELIWVDELGATICFVIGFGWFLLRDFKRTQAQCPDGGIVSQGEVFSTFILANLLFPFLLTICRHYFGIDDHVYRFIMQGYLCISVGVSFAYVLRSKKIGAIMLTTVIRNKKRNREISALDAFCVLILGTVLCFGSLWFSFLAEFSLEKVVNGFPLTYILTLFLWMIAPYVGRTWYIGLTAGKSRCGPADS